MADIPSLPTIEELQQLDEQIQGLNLQPINVGNITIPTINSSAYDFENFLKQMIEIAVEFPETSAQNIITTFENLGHVMLDPIEEDLEKGKENGILSDSLKQKIKKAFIIGPMFATSFYQIYTNQYLEGATTFVGTVISQASNKYMSRLGYSIAAAGAISSFIDLPTFVSTFNESIDVAIEPIKDMTQELLTSNNPLTAFMDFLKIDLGFKDPIIGPAIQTVTGSTVTPIVTEFTISNEVAQLLNKIPRPHTVEAYNNITNIVLNMPEYEFQVDRGAIDSFMTTFKKAIDSDGFGTYILNNPFKAGAYGIATIAVGAISIPALMGTIVVAGGGLVAEAAPELVRRTAYELLMSDYAAMMAKVSVTGARHYFGV